MRKLSLLSRQILLMLLFASLYTSASAQTSSQWNYLGCAGISRVYRGSEMRISSQGMPYILTDGFNEPSVNKFDGYSWSSVGNAVHKSTYTTSYVTMALDNNDVPYVGFTTYIGGGNYILVVKKYNGNSWATIKQDTTSFTSYLSMDADNNNNVYLAYRTSGIGLIVEKYSNNSWSMVGNAPVVTGNASFISLDIDRNNNPAVAFSDPSNNSKLSVYRYDGNAWNSIGNTGISAGRLVSNTTLVFDKNNTPYVFFREYTPSYNMDVIKYDGSNWTSIMTSTVPQKNVSLVTMSIDTNNAPIIAHTQANFTIGIYALIWRYDGNDWIPLSTAGEIQDGNYSSLAIDKNNKIYYGYEDKYANNGNRNYSVKVYDSTARYPKIRPHGPTTICDGWSLIMSIQSCKSTDLLQWYLNGNPINGATTDNYSASTAGNYTVGITSGGTTTYTDPLTLTVISPSVSISSVLANNTYTGGNANTIYLGYGPQSATLTANATGSSGFTYSWSPSIGLSCTNCQSPTFAPTIPGTYTYTVTATSSEGCTTKANINFCVLDVRDVNGNATNIYVCHNGKTASMHPRAVAVHLNHGDALGMCEQSCNSAAKGGKNNGETNEQSLEDIATEDAIQIYPNPNNGVFTIKGAQLVEGSTIVIRDITGKQIVQQNVNSDALVQLTLDSVADGIYIVEVHNDKEVYRERIVIRR